MTAKPDQTGPITTRRTALKIGSGTAAIALIGAPAILKRARAQSQFDWKRFDGQTLEVFLSKNPRADLLQQHEAEFEELTGIRVGSEQVPEQQHRQKQVIEFTSGNTSFDVTITSYHVQKRLFAKGMWLEDLRPYLDNPELTPPDYDFADFSEGSVAYARQADGRLDTLPFNIDPWIVYWNQELFAAKGLGYPDTFDGMLDAARELNDPANGVFGVVSRGLKNANAPVWTGFQLGWDQESVGPNGELQTMTPEAIAAAELYRDLNAQYAPPGVVGFNWNECQTSFMQGTVGMWIDGIGFAKPLEDAATSKVAGKVGYGIFPAGPAARHSPLFGSGLGVSAYTRKKEAAYLYCVWATNKLNQARMLQAGAGAPCRDSVYSDPQVQESLSFPEEWAESVVESARIARAGLPVIIPVTEFRDIFGVALTNMITGSDPAEELARATEQFRPILERSERA
jgi:multiple sugar transport system substrate-binding protein